MTGPPVPYVQAPLRIFLAEAIRATMARTKISVRLEREAREAEASRAGGGQDEGDAGSVEERGGGSDEEAPVRKEVLTGSSDNGADGGSKVVPKKFKSGAQKCASARCQIPQFPGPEMGRYCFWGSMNFGVQIPGVLKADP